MMRLVLPLLCIHYALFPPGEVLAASEWDAAKGNAPPVETRQQLPASVLRSRPLPPQVGLHADGQSSAWTFSQGESSRDVWREAMPMETLRRRAVKPQDRRTTRAVNTKPAIDSALRAIKKRRETKGDVGFSIKQESSSWREDALSQDKAPDEKLPMESRNVVGAYAGVITDDDLSIKVGPELILKDDTRENPHADNRQPESSLGLGMQFKLDF